MVRDEDSEIREDVLAIVDDVVDRIGEVNRERVADAESGTAVPTSAESD